MTPETKEAVRKSLEAIDSMIDHAEGTQRAPMCVKVGISYFVNEILAILDAESEEPEIMKSPREWADEWPEYSNTLLRDRSLFIDRIQQDAILAHRIMPEAMKSAEEWANETLPRKSDGSFDWVRFNESIQKDAETSGYARGLEHAATLIDASIYVKSENANMAKQIRALLPNAVKPK